MRHRQFRIVLALPLIWLATLLPTSEAHAATTPRAAVKTLLQPGNACVRHQPTYMMSAGCPITLRLQKRLQTILRYERTHQPGGGADPICRCQNTPQKTVYRVQILQGGQALVAATLVFGTQKLGLDFVVLQQGGAWRVDDVFCAARAVTSVYKQLPPRLCP